VPDDDGLRRIVEAWPSLPAALRAVMLAALAASDLTGGEQ